MVNKKCKKLDRLCRTNKITPNRKLTFSLGSFGMEDQHQRQRRQQGHDGGRKTTAHCNPCVRKTSSWTGNLVRSNSGLVILRRGAFSNGRGKVGARLLVGASRCASRRRPPPANARAHANGTGADDFCKLDGAQRAELGQFGGERAGLSAPEPGVRGAMSGEWGARRVSSY